MLISVTLLKTILDDGFDHRTHGGARHSAIEALADRFFGCGGTRLEQFAAFRPVVSRHC